jgi:hypothetical protein
MILLIVISYHPPLLCVCSGTLFSCQPHDVSVPCLLGMLRPTNAADVCVLTVAAAAQLEHQSISRRIYTDNLDIFVNLRQGTVVDSA